MGNARDAKSIAESKPDAFGQDTYVLLFIQEAIKKLLENTTFTEVLLSILQAHTNANGNDKNQHKHNRTIGMPKQRMQKHGYATEFTDNETCADQADRTTTNKMADPKARQSWDPFPLMELISRDIPGHARIQPLE